MRFLRVNVAFVFISTHCSQFFTLQKIRLIRTRNYFVNCVVLHGKEVIAFNTAHSKWRHRFLQAKIAAFSNLPYVEIINVFIKSAISTLLLCFHSQMTSDHNESDHNELMTIWMCECFFWRKSNLVEIITRFRICISDWPNFKIRTSVISVLSFRFFSVESSHVKAFNFSHHIQFVPC